MPYILDDHYNYTPAEDEYVYSWERNVYNHPERFGLTIVATAEEPYLSYEFNTFIVFKDEAGNFYYAHDQGCSCPTPFDYHDALADLPNWAALVDALEEWVPKAYYGQEHYYDEWQLRCQEVLRQAHWEGLR